MTTLTRHHQEQGIALRRICQAAHVGYRSFLRWKSRCGNGEPAVREPGPAPLGPLDMENVWERVRSLHHGHHRTRGTGALYEELRHGLSRRKLQAFIRHAREEQQADQAAAQWRLEWPATFGRVWAMDTTEIPLPDGTKFWFQTIRDLGSRYTLAPFGTRHPCGSEIAAWLEEAFRKHGAPLFLRMDNAANENCPEVMAVLARHWVIPYNSPLHYPRYNGGVERAQSELQDEFEDWTAGLAAVPPEHLPVYAANTVHGLNHKLRPVLGGRHACQVFTRDAGHAILTPGQRKEIVDELAAFAAVLPGDETGLSRHQIRRAWRHAVEWWLEKEGIIRVIQTPSVNRLPDEKCDIICVA